MLPCSTKDVNHTLCPLLLTQGLALAIRVCSNATQFSRVTPTHSTNGDGKEERERAAALEETLKDVLTELHLCERQGASWSDRHQMGTDLGWALRRLADAVIRVRVCCKDQ